MLRLGSILLLAFIIAGCASRAVAPISQVDWQARDQQLRELNAWELRGRIAVKAGDEGGQGSLQWQQAGEAARIGLSGPLGAGAVKVDWTPERIIIRDRDGSNEYVAAGERAGERYLEDQLGWPFPGDSFRYWVLGISDPAYGSYQTFNAAGRLQQLEQRGWTVSYDRYTDENGRLLPGKLVMQSKRVRIKLVIDDWLL